MAASCRPRVTWRFASPRALVALPEPCVWAHALVEGGDLSCEAFVRSYSGNVIIGMLGPNPTQERFRLAAYYLTDLAFQASGGRSLDWGGFMKRYSKMYPHGQPGLPDDSVTAYVDSSAP
jgi:hypothetical protein